MRRVQIVVNAIDTRLKSLQKEVAELKARCERLLSGVIASNRF